MLENFFILQILTWLITVLVAVFIVLFFLSAIFVKKMTSDVRHLGKRTPKDVGLDFEEHWVPTPEGHRLHLWFIPQNSEKCVIIAHGYTSSKSHDPYPEGEHYCFFSMKMLHEAGYNVAMFDFRAHGKSEGEMTTIGFKEANDIIAVIDWLKKEKETKSRKVGVIGYSMGAAATIFALTKDDKIDAAVADSPYASLERTIKRILAQKHLAALYPIIKFWAKRIAKINPAEVSPAGVADKIRAPLFIIVGTNDDLVSVDDVKEIYENAKKSGKEVQLWVVEGARHVRSHLKETEEYKKRVLEWFNKFLS